MIYVLARTGRRQDIVGEPCGKCSDIASLRMRSRFGLPSERDPFSKVRIPRAFPLFACSFLRRDLAPLAMPARVLARASH